MKKKLIIIISVIAILIILFFILFFSSGIKNYNSKLSNTQIHLPKSSFNIKEYQDEDTYTIMWYTLRDSDSIRKDIEKINSINCCSCYNTTLIERQIVTCRVTLSFLIILT